MGEKDCEGEGDWECEGEGEGVGVKERELEGLCERYRERLMIERQR